ncbi:DUF3304 domain-containing protein [Chromohalobacter nigrandesensis]|uniref:DUF3304 domain-containing protein n=1 Tax=Chromohalobacter nigrandesensis TaxID=119863 RepID=UPI001FF28F99|nr:DUF3304 domain-containing protein [Chromohalobacter nigrandesensis]MCK0745081.1 DUF3304 domain-containing protein [Chromohalobacter nigrandesensis]
MHHFLRRGLALLWLASLTACGDDSVSLNITGVDYAGQGIGSYHVVDPNDEQNRGGGESIGPYSAGGIMCCYEVPREWHEGVSVDVVVRYPLEGDTTDERSESLARRRAEGTLHETIHVEIPKYDTPAKGTLWVQFLPDKKANVVVSNLSPDHEDFPGEVKGWPVPSDEYRRKLIDREIKNVSSRLSRTEGRLSEVDKKNTHSLKKEWEIGQQVYPDKISEFNGWSDEEFIKYLKTRLRSAQKRDKNYLQKLREGRP